MQFVRYAGVCLGLLSALWVPVLPSFAETDANTIATQGYGEIKVKPDAVSLTISVDTQQPTLEKARGVVSQGSEKIIQSLKQLGVAHLTIRTQSVNVYPIQDYQQGKLPRTMGYQAHNSIEVTATQLSPEQLSPTGSKLMDIALNSGATNVGNLRFYADDLASYRRQALEKAYQDAFLNAQVLAKAANVHLGGVYAMEGAPEWGGSGIIYNTRAQLAKASDAESSIPVEAGDVTVTCQLRVKFKF